MITRKDLSDVYDWASHRKFPMKGNPSSPNYTNKKIYSVTNKSSTLGSSIYNHNSISSHNSYTPLVHTDICSSQFIDTTFPT